MSYRFVINHERLETWCNTHDLVVPQVHIVQAIPVNCGKVPFGDYTEKDAQIRILRLSSTSKDVKKMNETLWHELRHHWQINTNKAAYYKGAIGEYANRPIEKDARSYAKRALRKYEPIIGVVK